MAKLTTRFVNEIKPTDRINILWDDQLKGVSDHLGRKHLF